DQRRQARGGMRWPVEGRKDVRPRNRRSKPRKARPASSRSLGGAEGSVVRETRSAAVPGFPVRPQRWVKIVIPPGFSRSKPLTPRAGRRDAGVSVVTTLVWFFKFPHGAAGVADTRRSARPLFGATEK